LNIKKCGQDLGAFFTGPDEESVYYMQIEAGEMVTPTPLPASGNPTGATLDVEISPDIPLEMVQVPKGTFIMGSSENEVGHRPDERPQHQVTLTQNFYISKYEISVRQYKLFKPNHTINPINTLILDKDDYPVTSVSWEEATHYCEWLSSRSDYIFSLPTEAEWEYACRAGTTSRRYWGNDADNSAATAFANIADASYASMFGTEFITPFPGDDGAIGPADVGSYTANAFGLHDMLGNVWEWCADRYGPYENSAQTNPSGPASGNSRVFRGGSWQEGINGNKIRSAVRSALTPTSRDHRIGFRVVIREQE
jgi:formylglycine-generating enzyme